MPGLLLDLRNLSSARVTPAVDLARDPPMPEGAFGTVPSAQNSSPRRSPPGVFRLSAPVSTSLTYRLTPTHPLSGTPVTSRRRGLRQTRKMIKAVTRNSENRFYIKKWDFPSN